MCISLPVYSSVSSEMMMDVSEIHNDREISVVYIRKGSHFLSDLAPPPPPSNKTKEKQPWLHWKSDPISIFNCQPVKQYAASAYSGNTMPALSV